TCRPLPVSSHTRDMIFILISGRASARPEERRPLAARGWLVNAAPDLLATQPPRPRSWGQSSARLSSQVQHKDREALMRAVILILIVIIVAVIAAVATGFLDINQIRGGRTPQVATTGNGVVAKGGQAPAFDVETGTVKVGTKQTTVKVPVLRVEPVRNQAA